MHPGIHRYCFWNVLIFSAALSTAFAQSTVSPKTSPDTYARTPQIVGAGKQLFEMNCSPCHNFVQRGIGPNLAYATTENSAGWLKKFIRNAPDMIQQGDPRAKQLFADYGQAMPPFPTLTDANLDALLAFLHSRKKTVKTGTTVADGLKDPIPSGIASSGQTIQLAYISTAPATAQQAPRARINKMATLPGPRERTFVVDLRGKLYELADTTWKTALDMQALRPQFIPDPGMGSGFGSFAFHPEFYQNGLLYTTHTEKANAGTADFGFADSIKVALQWVLTEWRISDPNRIPFAGSSRELMRVNMVSSIHGVQEIAFNPGARKGSPDYGLLYIGIGDGGASENGYDFLCSDKRNVWGSVLRIDPAGRNSRNGHYGIPTANPYAADQDPATKQEIYCRGFRNPNRLSWMPTGNLLVSDIGHTQIEELNLAVAGADYGWPRREGTFVINPRGRMDQIYTLPADDKAANYVYPVAEYDHDEGKAISGGFVYEGSAVPPLMGQYVFGDLNSGRVFFVDARQLKIGQQTPIQEFAVAVDGKPTTFQTISGRAKPDVRFGQGANGELYVLTKSDGKLYRIVGVTK